MYFAINPPHADLPAQIAQEFAVLREEKSGHPLNLYALIDGAFNEAFFSEQFRTSLEHLSLYETLPLSSAGTASLYLLASPFRQDEQLAWLERLYAACEGKPMLSIIACTLNIDDMARHMRPYLVAITEDSLQWPVRWGDTRVLPSLIYGIAATYRTSLLAPIYQWWSANREGSITSWKGAGSEKVEPAPYSQLPLNDAEFAQLVDVAEADAVLSEIFNAQADILRKHTPAGCYARVGRHLLVADNYRIAAAGERQHLCTLSLLLNEELLNYGEIRSLLQRCQHGAEYFGEIEKLSDDFWKLSV